MMHKNGLKKILFVLLRLCLGHVQEKKRSFKHRVTKNRPRAWSLSSFKFQKMQIKSKRHDHIISRGCDKKRFVKVVTWTA